MSLAAREAIRGYSFTLPQLAFLGLTVFAPLAFTAYVTFFRWEGLSPIREAEFVGLQNYARLLGDERARLTYLRTLQFTLGSMVTQLGIGLALALAVRQLGRLANPARLIFFLPYILPTTVMGVVFSSLIFQPIYGIANQALAALHIPRALASWAGAPQWFLMPQSAMRALISMMAWKMSGLYMILFLAGLQAIPEEFYEAAMLDGAGRWRRFRHITLPLLTPTTAFCVVISVIGSMQVFTPLMTTTRGGPARATEAVVLHIFNTSFGVVDYSYGATMAIVLFLIMMAFIVAYLRLVSRAEQVH